MIDAFIAFYKTHEKQIKKTNQVCSNERLIALNFILISLLKYFISNILFNLTSGLSDPDPVKSSSRGHWGSNTCHS